MKNKSRQQMKNELFLTSLGEELIKLYLCARTQAEYSKTFPTSYELRSICSAAPTKPATPPTFCYPMAWHILSSLLLDPKRKATLQRDSLFVVCEGCKSPGFLAHTHTSSHFLCSSCGSRLYPSVAACSTSSTRVLTRLQAFLQQNKAEKQPNLRF